MSKALVADDQDRLLHIQLLESTVEMGGGVVEVGGDVVETGVKVLELPAQLLFEVLQYLPKARRTDSR